MPRFVPSLINETTGTMIRLINPCNKHRNYVPLELVEMDNKYVRYEELNFAHTHICMHGCAHKDFDKFL